MAKLEVINMASGGSGEKSPLTALGSADRLELSQAIRLGILSLLLGFIFFFKFYQAEFINTGIWQPIMLVLMLSFLLNSFGVIFPQAIGRAPLFNSALFGFDTIVFASLVSGVGVGKSLFIFLFLVNIILCGFVYGRKGAFYLALWTTFVFNTVTLFGSEIAGMSMYSSTILNNISFFAVATLSGMFSRELEVSEVKIKEQSGKIQALSELNDLIVENAASGIISVDRSGKINYANASAERILSENDLKGLKFEKVIPSAVGILNELHSSQRFELAYQNYKGEQLELELIASPLHESESVQRGYVCLIQDYTELKRLQFSLRQKEKLAAVGQLAAGIAHEIRNPLASISGSIQLLAQGGELKGEDQRLMRIVVREIDRLNTLISEFLVFVRPESIPDEPVSVGEVVKDVLDLVKVNEQLNLDFEPISELHDKQIVFGHRDKLKQAILNMVINGVQALENETEPSLQLRTYDDQDKVIFVLKDNGCGMSAETAKRIFEPFHTTKSKGTGLGMAITHKILESHGATVFVDSEVNQGTTFTVEFPIVDNSLPDEKRQKATA